MVSTHYRCDSRWPWPLPAWFLQVCKLSSIVLHSLIERCQAVWSDMLVFSDSDPFKVVSNAGDKPMIGVTYKGEEKQFSAEEISSMVFIKMKEIAEAYLGTTIKDPVVTVPTALSHQGRRCHLEKEWVQIWIYGSCSSFTFVNKNWNFN